MARPPIESPLEAALRREAIAWVLAQSAAGLGEIHHTQLASVPLMSGSLRLKNPQRGIWRPAGWDAALSIVTTYRRRAADRPYDDAPGVDGLWRYKWMGQDPNHPDNVGLRSAMRSRVPLIWFIGVDRGTYIAVAPVWILAEEPGSQQFVVAVERSQRLPASEAGLPAAIERQWVAVESRRRVHQPLFRRDVLHAYASHCAVCRIQHAPLLDAAHIIPDTAPHGDAMVTNGLALCKIHHAAYDSNILGITPEYRVQIQHAVLQEQDGPMLQHGLQELHGQQLLWVPHVKHKQPDPDRLAERYREFLDAA